MSYEKQNFVNDQTLTADHLNHIEDGMEQLDEHKLEQEDLPCYDDREYETIESSEEFNGDTTGKTVVTQSQVEGVSVEERLITPDITYIKMADEAPTLLLDLPLDSYEDLYLMMEKGDLDVKAVLSNGVESLEMPFTIQYLETYNPELGYCTPNESVVSLYNEDMWIDAVHFVYEECDIYDAGGKFAHLTPGVWHTSTYHQDSQVTIYTVSFEIKVIISGELKILDTKFLPDIVGRRLDGQSFDVKKSYHDEEYETITAGENAEAFNSTLNIAIGNNSHVEGRENVARGESSHAEGMYTYANGGESHAEGYFSVANGNMSHAEGMGTVTEGYVSHAEGSHSVANGWGSHAEGKGTIASGDIQHVQGQYNIEDTESKYAHIVGNGSSYYDGANGTNVENRSNAHTLDWNGNAWFQGNVSIDGTPTNDNDLITKKYVDRLAANAAIMNIAHIEEIDALIENNNINVSDYKYQRVEMFNNANIVLPEVNTFTEIHLFFDTTEDLTINLPDCRKKQLPEILANKSYELVAIYNTNYWLVEINVFE